MTESTTSREAERDTATIVGGVLLVAIACFPLVIGEGGVSGWLVAPSSIGFAVVGLAYLAWGLGFRHRLSFQVLGGLVVAVAGYLIVEAVTGQNQFLIARIMLLFFGIRVFGGPGSIGDDS